jgi:hypothetical protein
MHFVEKMRIVILSKTVVIEIECGMLTGLTVRMPSLLLMFRQSGRRQKKRDEKAGGAAKR